MLSSLHCFRLEDLEPVGRRRLVGTECDLLRTENDFFSTACRPNLEMTLKTEVSCVFLHSKTVLASQKEPKKEPRDGCAVKLPYTVVIFGCR